MGTKQQKQKLSYKEKIADDLKWFKDNIDFYTSGFGEYGAEQEMDALYSLLTDEINLADYKYVINPLNSTEEKYTKFPARLRNYNIIEPIINLFMGEKTKRAFNNWQVIVNNPDSINLYKEKLNKDLISIFSQSVINTLNSIGFPTNKNNQETPDISDYVKNFDVSYDDNRAVFGQEAFDYLYNNLDLENQIQLLMLDWLAVGRVFTFKTVENDDIFYEILDPRDVRHPTPKRNQLVEDMPWFASRRKITLAEIMERYGDELTEKDLEKLEVYNSNKSIVGTGWTSGVSIMGNDVDYSAFKTFNNGGSLAPDEFFAYHCTWRGLEQYGDLTYVNELGQIKQREVDEDYKLNKALGDIEIKWGWKVCIYEGTKIELTNSEDALYLTIGKIPIKREELDNRNTGKLQYNGIFNLTPNNTIVSVCKSGRNYQILSNIIWFQYEKTINKNKGKVLIIPRSLLKSELGWSEEKKLYFTESMGMLVVDDASPNFTRAVQGMKEVDLSRAREIVELFNIIENLKYSWWESIGVNRQRYGDIKTSDGKGVTEQATYRSAIISEEMFRKFEFFEEKEYAGFLDYSKLAWVNGKRGMYINSEGRKRFLELNVDNVLQHLETSYGVFIKNSSKEREKLDMLKQIVFPIAQNDGDISLMLEIIDANSFSKGKQIVSKLTANIQEKQQQNQEQITNIEEQKNQILAQANDLKKYEIDMNYKKVIDAALIQAETKESKEGPKTDWRKIDLDYEQMRLKWEEFNHKVLMDNKNYLLNKEKIKKSLNSRIR